MSRQVKIVIANEHYDEDYGSRINVEGSITDWEEISDEDYLLLVSNFHILFPYKSSYGGYSKEKYILLTKDDEQISSRIVKLQELLLKQKEKIEKQKQKEIDDKRKREVKKAENERKKYEALKVKYES